MGTKILGTVLAALILAASAYADAIFTPGNHPQPDEENIHFTHQTGPAVFGTTDVSGTMVDYLATTNLNAHGVNIDGPIVNITIKVPGHDFEDYIVNAFNGGVPPDVVLLGGGLVRPPGRTGCRRGAGCLGSGSATDATRRLCC